MPDADYSPDAKRTVGDTDTADRVEHASVLTELTTSLHYTDDPDLPVDWFLCRADDNPDVLWALEFYKDGESFARHFSDPDVDDTHDKVFDLLAEAPLRVEVHPVAFS